MPSNDTSGEAHDTASDGSGLREGGQALTAGLQQAYAAALGNGHHNPSASTGLEGHGRTDPSGGGKASDLMSLALPGQAQPDAQPEDNATTGGKREKPPRPDTVAPCPRCGSSDTKFCYYNNYNVKQPRYFCKACQRYWTAGGTLRNVPPGSGRRKSKSQAAKEQEKQTALAEQLAKQSVANAMLAANPAAAGLAAAVPFLNPMLAADSAMLAYNAAAQQQLLGTAALNALSKMPGQWPNGMGNGNGNGSHNGLNGVDSSGLPSPSANGHGGPLNSGDDQLNELTGHQSKRQKLDNTSNKLDQDHLLSSPVAQPSMGNPSSATDDSANTAAAQAAAAAAANAINGMSHHHLSGGNGGFPMGHGQLVSLGSGWPGLGTDQLAMNMGSQGNHNDPSNMMGGQKQGQSAAQAAQAAQSAAAAQTALHQQHMAYQQMMHAQLLQQQLAAQAQVAAAGLGHQSNPYLSLQHLAYNPFNYAAAAANPALANLGFNPSAGR